MPNDPIEIITIPLDDKYVKISDADTVRGYLTNKIVEGSGINVTVTNVGNDEQLVISAEGGGGSGDEEFIVDFNYTSSSPVTICTVSPLGTITKAKFVLDTIFDGTVSMTLGINGNNNILMDTIDIDPYYLASYVTYPDAELGDGEVVRLYMSIVGASQGVGRVIVNITR